MMSLFRTLLAAAALVAAAAQDCGGFRDPPCPDGSCTFTPNNGARVQVIRGNCLPCGRDGAAACPGAFLLYMCARAAASPLRLLHPTPVSAAAHCSEPPVAEVCAQLRGSP